MENTIICTSKIKNKIPRIVGICIIVLEAIIFVCYAVKMFNGDMQMTEGFPQISQAEIYNILRVLIFTLIPAILTCLGTSLTNFRLKLSDWKNRKAVKYILVNSIEKFSFKNFIKKCGVFIVEISWIISSIYIMLGMIEVLMVFARIWTREIVESRNILIIFSLSTNMILILSLLTFYKDIRACKSILPVTFALFESILLIMQVMLVTHNIKVIFLILSIAIMAVIASIIYTLKKLGFYKNYKSWILKVSIATRYFILAGMILQFWFRRVVPQGNSFMVILWIVLSSMEYLYIVFKNEEDTINITIHVENKDIVTKNKIIQYENGLIKYKLLNGYEEIIKNDEIEYITYQFKKFPFEELFGTKKVECILQKDSKILKFQYYKLIRDSWVGFYKIKGNIKEIFIYKTEDIKKITIKEE